jgi:hypothetical protein
MSSLLVIKPEETEALYLEDMSYSFFFFLFSFPHFANHDSSIIAERIPFSLTRRSAQQRGTVCPTVCPFFIHCTGVCI